jgi:hypothetical protein
MRGWHDEMTAAGAFLGVPEWSVVEVHLRNAKDLAGKMEPLLDSPAAAAHVALGILVHQWHFILADLLHLRAVASDFALSWTTLHDAALSNPSQAVNIVSRSFQTVHAAVEAHIASAHQSALLSSLARPSALATAAPKPASAMSDAWLAMRPEHCHFWLKNGWCKFDNCKKIHDPAELQRVQTLLAQTGRAPLRSSAGPSLPPPRPPGNQQLLAPAR